MAERKPLFLSDEGYSAEMNVADTATFGGLTLSGDIAMGGNLVTGLGAGVNNTDAVNKSQLDAAISGLDTKDSVRLATAASLPANTAAGAGPGKTLTGNANGALSVDGVAVALNDRILVKDETAGADVDHGIYTVTQAGDGANPFILTRATDFDQDAEVTASAYVFVNEGSDNQNSGWTVSTNNPITVDTTAIAWTQFNGLGQVTAGAGLSKTGNQLDVEVGDGIEIVVDRVTVDLSTTSGLELLGATPNGELQAKVDPNGAIERITAGLGVKLNGTTLRKVAAGLSVRGLPSLFEVNGVAVAATVTAANLDTLTDGSNADALHAHLGTDEAERVENDLNIDSAVTAGDPVYFTGTGDRIAKADAGTLATTRPIGVARIGQVTVGNPATIVANGIAAGVLASATPGSRFYLGVGGGLTSARPTGTGNRVIQMGFAKNASDLWLEIQDYGRLA